MEMRKAAGGSSNVHKLTLLQQVKDGQQHEYSKNEIEQVDLHPFPYHASQGAPRRNRTGADHVVKGAYSSKQFIRYRFHEVRRARGVD